MSVPAYITAQNLSGQWTLNKSLSDSLEPSLCLQGVAWITRKTLSKASISLKISQYVDDSGHHHFDIEQRTLGRLVEQKAVLDGGHIALSHPLFGNISMTQTLTPLNSIEEHYLTESWEIGEQKVIDLKVINEDAGWESRQILGIELVGGQRRHTRRAIVTKGDEVVKARLVYDWQGST